MVKSICINDINRPSQIPLEKWVEKGKEYTIIYIYWHPNQGVQGVLLSEVELDESCAPFESYKIERFALPKSEIIKFIDLCKMCTQMNSVDIEEVIEQLTLEEV